MRVARISQLFCYEYEYVEREMTGLTTFSVQVWLGLRNSWAAPLLWIAWIALLTKTLRLEDPYLSAPSKFPFSP